MFAWFGLLAVFTFLLSSEFMLYKQKPNCIRRLHLFIGTRLWIHWRKKHYHLIMQMITLNCSCQCRFKKKCRKPPCYCKAFLDRLWPLYGHSNGKGTKPCSGQVTLSDSRVQSLRFKTSRPFNCLSTHLEHTPIGQTTLMPCVSLSWESASADPAAAAATM